MTFAIFLEGLPDNFEIDEVTNWLDDDPCIIDVKRHGTSSAQVTLEKESAAQQLIDRKNETRFNDELTSVKVSWQDFEVSKDEDKNSENDDSLNKEHQSNKNFDTRTKVFIMGLPINTSWQDLKDKFRAIPGEIGYVLVDNHFSEFE